MDSLFDQIPNVAGPFSLAAFIASAVVLMVRAQINRDRKLIETASEDERGRLVERVLGKVDTEGMSAAHKFELARDDLRGRSRRFLTIAIVIVLLALIAAGVGVVALLVGSSPPIHETGDGGKENSTTTTPAPAVTTQSPVDVPQPAPAPAPKPDPTISVSLVRARLIWPKSGVSDPSQYPAAGFPTITNDQIEAIRAVAEDGTNANNIKTFFSAGSIDETKACVLTMCVWDDGDGFPDRNSVQLGGNMDKDHANQILATFATVKFPAPAKVPIIPKAPGVLRPEDLQNAPTHMSYFEIKVQVQASLPPQS